MRNCWPLCGGTRISRSYGSSSPSRLMTDLAGRVDRLDVEERVELDALGLEDRRRHVGHALDREGAADRRAEVASSRAVADAALAELRLDEERDLERRRRALVGHPGDADDDPAAAERVERRAQRRPPPRRCRSGGPRCRSARSPRARCASRSPGPAASYAERQAVGQSHDRRVAFVDAGDLADDERDPLVEQRALRAAQSPAACSPPIAMYMKPGW